MLLADFNAKFGRDDIFKPTIWNKSLHQDINDNSVRITNLATSKILVVKSMVFHTEKFINTPETVLMGRLTTRLML